MILQNPYLLGLRGHWINNPHFFATSLANVPRGLSDPMISHYTLPRELDDVATVVSGEQ